MLEKNKIPLNFIVGIWDFLVKNILLKMFIFNNKFTKNFPIFNERGTCPHNFVYWLVFNDPIQFNLSPINAKFVMKCSFMWLHHKF
jgi:hypothetical protein